MRNLEFRTVALRDTCIGKAFKCVLALSALTAAAVFEVGNYQQRNVVELERIELRKKMDEVMEQNKKTDREFELVREILKEMVGSMKVQTRRLDIQDEILKEIVRSMEAQGKRLDLQREEIRKLKMRIEEKK